MMRESKDKNKNENSNNNRTKWLGQPACNSGELRVVRVRVRGQPVCFFKHNPFAHLWSK